MAIFTDDISINTIIGPEAFISGDLRIAGFVRVDGDIDGNLETTGRIIIGEKARIRGNVTALAAIVGGIIEGDVYAPESIKLMASSSVMGDVMTKKLNLETNCILHGQCINISDDQEFEDAVEKLKDFKAVRSKAIITGMAN